MLRELCVRRTDEGKRIKIQIIKILLERGVNSERAVER